MKKVSFSFLMVIDAEEMVELAYIRIASIGTLLLPCVTNAGVGVIGLDEMMATSTVRNVMVAGGVGMAGLVPLSVVAFVGVLDVFVSTNAMADASLSCEVTVARDELNFPISYTT